VLPLGPTGYGGNPYQSFSAFAGNPYFIDPDKLSSEGLLEKSELESSGGIVANRLWLAV
jgi:4-alpha-glucanotransferase